MSGYTVVLSPIAAIMIVDYWLVKRGNIDVPAMYRPEGRYRYWNGFVSDSNVEFALRYRA